MRAGNSKSPYFDTPFSVVVLMNRLLWWLIAGSKGGASRAIMLRHLHHRPSNANQLATALSLDYKTVRHHLRVLEENGLVTTVNREGYGAMYFLSSVMESSYQEFEEICSKIGLGGREDV